jgi:hypothetical protein
MARPLQLAANSVLDKLRNQEEAIAKFEGQFVHVARANLQRVEPGNLVGGRQAIWSSAAGRASTAIARTRLAREGGLDPSMV